MVVLRILVSDYQRRVARIFRHGVSTTLAGTARRDCLRRGDSAHHPDHRSSEFDRVFWRAARVRSGGLLVTSRPIRQTVEPVAENVARRILCRLSGALFGFAVFRAGRTDM